MSETVMALLAVLAVALTAWSNDSRLERQIKVLQRRVFDLENPHLAAGRREETEGRHA